MSDQASVTFKDVAGYFSEAEWDVVGEWQKELYKKVVEELRDNLISRGYSIVNPDVIVRIKKEDEKYFTQHFEWDGKENPHDPMKSLPIVTSVFPVCIKEEDDLPSTDHSESETSEQIHPPVTSSHSVTPDILIRFERERFKTEPKESEERGNLIPTGSCEELRDARDATWIKADNEASVTFKDVAAYFLDVEWSILGERQKELYKKAIKEIHDILTSQGYSIVNPDVLFKIKKEDEKHFTQQFEREGKEKPNDPPRSLPVVTSVFTLNIKQEEDLPFADPPESETSEQTRLPVTSSQNVTADHTAENLKVEEVLVGDQLERGEEDTDTKSGLPDVTSLFTVIIKEEDDDPFMDPPESETSEQIQSSVTGSSDVKSDILVQLKEEGSEIEPQGFEDRGNLPDMGTFEELQETDLESKQVECLRHPVRYLQMSQKRKFDASAGDASKKRKTITIEQKVEIIKRSERGETPSSIGKALGYSRSTIGTILKDKVKIMDYVKGCAPLKATIITKQRSSLIIKMEKLLIVWLEDQNQRNIPISLSLVRAKARSLFSDLKAREENDECDEEFVASRGWFNRFKVRANLHTIKVQGEVAGADVSAARSFPEQLKNIIEEGGYIPDQIFNVVETELCWRKMPEKNDILKEEKIAPGHKVSKDRLTLLLGGNASGDFKLKPLLVYHSLNPRALSRVIKAALPVIWKANSKAWVTLAIFEDWFKNHFIPAVEHYCLEKEIPFKILLVLDNAPGHRSTSGELHPNVNVVFLPPNTTSLLQPMDQGVIASFKAYYLRQTFSQAVKATQDNETTLRDFWKSYNIYGAIKNIAQSWNEVKKSKMEGVWKKLCPQFAPESQVFTGDDITEARRAVVDIGNQLKLDIDENDVVELLASRGKELSNEDLIELEKQMEAVEENGELDMPEQKKFTTKELAEAFRLIEAGMAKLEEQDPNTERFTKVYRAVSKDLSCYKAIYNEKKKRSLQSSLDAYFKKSYLVKPAANPHQQTANTDSSEVNPDSPATGPSSPTQDPSSTVAISPSSSS
uniref:Tigger transposable element-derived protein 1-like isoform X1 n=1 Tax=Geotrypetes seraphini TaxID=260995 RepID=A0A6P8SH00_GEOSA|nr:tigger transposable element-derived protein 1-like isoform X1 [Geotrypetes seraphini]